MGSMPLNFKVWTREYSVLTVNDYYTIIVLSFSSLALCSQRLV